MPTLFRTILAKIGRTSDSAVTEPLLVLFPDATIRDPGRSAQRHERRESEDRELNAFEKALRSTVGEDDMTKGGRLQSQRANVLFCLTILLSGSWAAPAQSVHAAEPKSKPNIVLLYIDDWAWSGSPVAMDDGMPNSRMPVVEMPNVERLAREGMRFRNAYASPQCSPGRVCVQTGQSSPRNGFTVFMNDEGQEYYDAKSYRGFPVVPCISDMTIDPDARTIPKALKPLGYTSAHIGKWHMRGDPGDEGYVLHDGDTSNKPGNTLVANLAEGESKPKRLPPDLSDPKLMFSVTEKAIGFIEEQVEKEQPFYVQISHYAMHAGSECLPATREKYAKHPLVRAWYEANDKDADTVRIGDDPAVWLGMAEDLDGRIGAVLDRLDELGIAENTYVVLVADNGYRHRELGLTPGLTQPHHASKWWVWQGGIRVPMIVRGPGIESGSVFHGNVVNYDLLPTFVDWAGGNPTELEDVDGVSLAPYAAGKTPGESFLNRRLYFHYPHYRTTMPHSAIVAGSRKVIHFYERRGLPMLFDLAKDPGEVHNIAADHAREHEQLHREMMEYLERVGARIPKPNPDHDPATYKAAKEYEKRVAWGPFEGRRSLDEDERPADEPDSPQSLRESKPGERPNVVLVLADDLGYGDLACYGANDIATPHIDRMAAEGAKFTSFYVAPVCSPTRAALMTGCYPQRVGIGGVLFPRNDHGLNPTERTLPELLKDRGYATAIIGKWHLGNEDVVQPLNHGFDAWYGTPSSNSQFYYPTIKKYADDCLFREGYTRAGILERETAACPLVRDNVVIEVPADQTQFTQRYTREAIEFITANKDKPFFVYLPHNMPHIPLHASDPFVGTSKRGIYGDAIQELDWSTGRILATLEKLDLDEKTLVIFTSDNGPNLGKQGRAEPLKGGKGSTHEGGVRVPFVARWPGRIPAGLETDEPITIMDLLPTLTRLAGAEVPDDRVIDGRDIWPLLSGAPSAKSPHDAIYYTRGRSVHGIRMGDWKYRRATDKPAKGEKPKRGERVTDTREKEEVETLHNLREDIGERRNRLSEQPEIAERLRKQLATFEAELRRSQRPAGVASKP